MSNIMNYIPEVLHNVHGVLSRIEANDGKITSKLLKSEVERLKGQWPSEVINVVLIALGREAAVSGMVADQRQINSLVIMANRDFSYIIGKIQAMRKAREEAKASPTATAPEPTITVVDLEDDGYGDWTPEEKQLLEERELLIWQAPLDLTVQQAAQKLRISEQRVRLLCAEGHFPDASKHGNAWVVPTHNAVVYALDEHKAGRPSKAIII